MKILIVHIANNICIFSLLQCDSEGEDDKVGYYGCYENKACPIQGKEAFRGILYCFFLVFPLNLQIFPYGILMLNVSV